VRDSGVPLSVKVKNPWS